MRLHRLELTGVGPFLRRQEIDFDALSQSGLFLIDGPTGSGKTTIIDAIVYALFGDVSGGGDSDTSRIRSSYCADGDPTGVALEFTVDGRRHRITRVPANARDPEQPARAAPKSPRQVLTEFAADGSEKTVLTKVTDIRQHVEALLAMTSEQFRHLVVLPQGKFADLLRMTPADRLTELASLLDHREFFARVQEDLKQQGLRVDEQRRAAREAVAEAAQQLAGRLGVHLEPGEEEAFTDPSGADDERMATVDTIVARLTDQLAEATTRRDAARTRAEERRRAADTAREAARALAEVGAARQELDDATAALLGDDHDLPPTEVRDRIGELRTREGALGELVLWEAHAPARAQQRQALADEEAEARREAEVLRTERGLLPEQRAQLEARISSTQQRAASLATAGPEVARLTQLVEKSSRLSTMTAELERRERELDRAESAAAESADRARRAHADWLALVERQRAHQALALATALTDGEPCPVCGSPEHPHPADTGHAVEVVTDEQIIRARTDATEAEAAAANATGRARAVREDRDAQATQVAALTGAVDDVPYADLVQLRDRAVEAEQDALAASDELPDLRVQLGSISDRDAALSERISELLASAAQSAGQLLAHDEAEVRGQERVTAAIGDAASATALVETVRARIARLEAADRAHARWTTATAAVPADQRQRDLAGAEADAAAAEADAAGADRDRAQAEADTSTLASALAESTPLAGALRTALADRRTVDAQTAPAFQLAQLAAGRNTRSLPLRSYALQRRFEAVLAAATVHLSRMSSGKFSFELNEETTRGQSGLGITLHDAWTGHRQEPKSLSGGETFYAALSLALGLADVVRGEAGGSALETLFIDEGFGSLDQDALYQVLDQLDHLRAGRRVIGVISHVTEMKESIPDRIEVRRGPDSTSSVTSSLGG